MPIDVIQEVAKRFPFGEVDTDLGTLTAGNIAWTQRENTMHDKQQPRLVVLNCSKFCAEEIFDLPDRMGWDFVYSLRGIALTDQALATIDYVRHLTDESKRPSAKVLAIIPHECSALNKDCRQGGPVRELRQGWDNDLKVIEFTDIMKGVPEKDIKHAQKAARTILSQLPEIQALVASGELLIAEGFCSNDVGNVVYPSFITSKKNGVDENLLRLIIDGAKIPDPQILPKSLQVVYEMVKGNERYVEKRRHQREIPTRYVFLTCADSRNSPYQTASLPRGIAEVQRVAGQMVNGDVVRSLVLAVTDAIESQLKAMREGRLPSEHKAQVIVFCQGHTRCGAVNAVVNDHCSGHVRHHEPTLEPIYKSIAPRLEGPGKYFEKNPDCQNTDQILVEAGWANAKQAAYEIVNCFTSEGALLRNWIKSGIVKVIPALYYLRTGGLYFDNPVFPAEFTVVNQDGTMRLPVIPDSSVGAQG